jgi:flagellar protein FliO/FliZ
MNQSVDLLRALLSLVFVLGLIWTIGLVIRKHGWRIGLPTAPLNGRNRRLQIIETLPLDAKNRAILLRRDDVEHLVIVGNDTAQLIESYPQGSTTP